MTPTKDAALAAFIAQEGERPVNHYSVQKDFLSREMFAWDAKLSGFRLAWEMLHEDAERGKESGRIVVELVEWLEANQPDVFRRGLWDNINAVGKGEGG